MIRLFRFEDQFNERLIDTIKCGDILELKEGVFGMITDIKEEVVFKIIIVLEKGDNKNIISDKILDITEEKSELLDVIPDIYKYIMDKYVC